MTAVDGATVLALPVQPLPPALPRPRTLDDLIDRQLLLDAGYDFQAQHFILTDDERLQVMCRTCGADLMRSQSRAGRLCNACYKEWVKQNQPDLETWEYFPYRGRGVSSRIEQPLCKICCTPGHERPAESSGLCYVCLRTMRKKQQRVDEFTRDPANVPRASFGRCATASCDRWAEGMYQRKHPLCKHHMQALSVHLRSADDTVVVAEFLAAAPAADDLSALRGRPQIVLAALPPLVRQQVLACFCLAVEAQYMRAAQTASMLAQIAERLQLQDLFAVDDWDAAAAEVTNGGESRRRNLGASARTVLTYLRRALTSPEEERQKDSWDLRVFGYDRGVVHFTGVGGTLPPIRQPWLLKATKEWVWQEICANKSNTTLMHIISATAEFSKTLCDTREDQGEDITRLRRADITAHMMRLASLERSGKLSNNAHVRKHVYIKKFFEVGRSLGWTESGGPLEGLHKTCRFHGDDQIRYERRTAEDEVAGKSLPAGVIDQLFAPQNLATCDELCGPEVTRAILIQANVGRRTQEIVGLRYECLAESAQFDEAGNNVGTRFDLIYDDKKTGLKGRHLPIHASTAAHIQAQQEYVRKQFPNTPTAELALFPREQQNREGKKSPTSEWLNYNMGKWLAAIPDIVGPEREANGDLKIFDKTQIFPYAFRHTFAQRHADRGTDPEVLMKLMGHTQMSTTQGYYQVTRQRMRKAVEIIGPLQMTATGERVSTTLTKLLDGDSEWQSLGGVAVTYGICFEPTMLRSHGQTCPFSHQCLGCGHFRTDATHLPDLRHFLQRRLADEHMIEMAQEAGLLQPWAAETAAPKPREIEALRHLIERCEESLGVLSHQDRGVIEAAMQDLDAARRLIDESMPDEIRHSIRHAGVTHLALPHQELLNDGSGA